ncbi:MAG: [Eubacterium sp.]|nr:[FeFe] hydrogenase H-cluster radical SAM maturase HydE [Eubacterium sp.]
MRAYDKLYIVDKVRCSRNISEKELETLLGGNSGESEYLYHHARKVADEVFGKKIYLRGLIEFSNYCKNNCLYCGIRRDNKNADRYRLSADEIISCADAGYELGFRTIVLQSGEDVFYTDDLVCEIISEIKKRHPDIAVTLSIGEKERSSYQAYYDAGADRYLLRHETADREHYELLHSDDSQHAPSTTGSAIASRDVDTPGSATRDKLIASRDVEPATVTATGKTSYDNRMRCLRDLKEIGYQVGCGFMVGSPGQDIHCLYEDLQFIREFRPHMVGIGPFLSQKDTPFANEKNGTADMTLALLSIIRLLDPQVLLPATTALGTVDPQGRERGILAGANVVMPNLSPVSVRDKYILYDNKICTGEEAAECVSCLNRRIENIGYQVVTDRGDHDEFRR